MKILFHVSRVVLWCVANKGVCSQELSNDIESLLEEVRSVQTRLSDLPDESLEAMEGGLKVSFQTGVTLCCTVLNILRAREPRHHI